MRWERGEGRGRGCGAVKVWPGPLSRCRWRAESWIGDEEGEECPAGAGNRSAIPGHIQQEPGCQPRAHPGARGAREELGSALAGLGKGSAHPCGLHTGSKLGALEFLQPDPRSPGSSDAGELQPQAPRARHGPNRVQNPQTTSPLPGHVVWVFFFAEFLKCLQSSRSSGRSWDSPPGSGAPRGWGWAALPRYRSCGRTPGTAGLAPKRRHFPRPRGQKTKGRKHLEEPRARGCGEEAQGARFRFSSCSEGSPKSAVPSLSPLVFLPPEPLGRDRDLFAAPGKAF